MSSGADGTIQAGPPGSPYARCVIYALTTLLGGGALDDSLLRRIVYQSPQGSLPASAVLCIVPSGFFGEGYGTPASMPALPLKEVEGVPLLYGTPEISRQGGCVVVRADIIASAYFMLTRYEDFIFTDRRDSHGRFLGKTSLPYRAGFLHRPIVDEYGVLLRRWLREAGVPVLGPRARFSVFLTHDVDRIAKYAGGLTEPFHTMAVALSGRPIQQNILENLAVLARLRKDPFNVFDEMLALDCAVRERCKDASVRIGYYFLAGHRDRGGGYDIAGRRARQLIRQLKEAGAFIGLHTSRAGGLEPHLIAQEKARLEEVCGFPVTHNRHHFLNWGGIEHGWQLAATGITDDSTLGYHDVAGFRMGTCRPFLFFDPGRMLPIGFVEHPLLVMDSTLDTPEYMGLGEEDAYQYCAGLLKETRRHGGEFVTLWHNTTLVPGRGNYHPRLYRRLLGAICGDERAVACAGDPPASEVSG